MMINHSIPFSVELEGWWCIIHQHTVYLPAPTYKIPCGVFSQCSLPVHSPPIIHQIGVHENLPVYLIEAHTCRKTGDFVDLRTILFQQIEMFEFASRAYQISVFLRTHQYCGQCGNPMTLVDWELATHCRSCNHRCYPRISPCVIVAIRDKDKILLAQGKNPKNNRYSVLAGFVESGETLEQAVHREVFEEVGIKIKNVTYVMSQPWPFPHSLMAGFTAEYESGELRLCEQEIATADWYGLDNLPDHPPSQSISGQLIERTKVMMKFAAR